MKTTATICSNIGKMYAEIVKNRICRCVNGFHCFLCKVDLANEDEMFSHVISDTKHLDELNDVVSLKNLKIDEEQATELINNGIIVTNSREYTCTFCLCDIPIRINLKQVSEHISGKKHITKRKKQVFDSTKDLVYVETSNEQDNNNKEIDNHVPDDCNSQKSSIDIVNENIYSSVQSNLEATQSENLFFCNKCEGVFKSSRASPYHCMFHLNLFDEIFDIINFYVKDNTKLIHCLICDCDVENEDDLDKHLLEDLHVKRLIILQCPSNDTIMNIMYLNYALYPNIVIPSATNVYNTLNEEFCRYLYYLQNVSQARIERSQVNTKLLDSDSPIISLQVDTPQKNDIISHTYFCFICNAKFLNKNLLIWHYNNDYIHKYRIESIIFIFKDDHIKFVNFDNNEIIKCLKCQINFTELNGVILHLFDMQHLCDKSVECVSIGPNGEMLVNDKNLYTCSICNIHVPTDTILIQHLTSDYHKIKSQQYYSNFNNESSFKKVIFHCPKCKMNFFNDNTVLQHFYLRHQNGHKVSIPLTNAVYPNVYIIPNNTQLIPAINNPGMPQYYNVKNNNSYSMPSNNLNFIQNNTIDLNMNPQQTTIQTVPVNNNYQNKKKIGNSALVKKRNPVNFSPRYVQLCIERGDENIFTMNVEKVKSLELGISLTFPYNSNRCCIPCGYEVSSDVQLLYEHLRSEEHEENLQEMEDNDKYFENFPNQLSDLELSKEYMHEDSDEWVLCFACDIKIENYEVNLRNHIDSDLHCTNHRSFRKSADDIIKLFKNIFENLWYYIEKFFCFLCCVSYESEIAYARHLESISHLKEVERRLIKNESLQFDCCILCSSYWYSKSDFHKKHCSKESHLYILKTRDFTVPDMSSEVKLLLTTLEQTIDRLVEESDLSAFCGRETENKLLRNIEQVVMPRYPRAKAYLFGSRISRISFQDSDFDIFLDCEKEYGVIKSKEDVEDQIARVQDCFFRHNNIWKIEKIILRTRVPIITLKHKSSNFNCDISFCNSLSVEKSKILGYFVNAYLPARKMILLLKKWSALCNLSVCRGINNFALAWFVIFYLQVKGIFPSVQQLIEQKNESRLVEGWETGVSEKISVNDTNASIKDLIRGFFIYYNEFNYISDVACPFLGKIMKKNKFFEIDGIPDEMSFYKSKLMEEKIQFFRLDAPMCIQEPIDLSQNITKSVTKLQLRMFKQYCYESATILTN